MIPWSLFSRHRGRGARLVRSDIHRFERTGGTCLLKAAQSMLENAIEHQRKRSPPGCWMPNGATRLGTTRRFPFGGSIETALLSPQSGRGCLALIGDHVGDSTTVLDEMSLELAISNPEIVESPKSNCVELRCRSRIVKLQKCGAYTLHD